MNNKYFMNIFKMYESVEEMAKACGEAYTEYLMYTYNHPGKYAERHKTGHTCDYDGKTKFWFEFQAWTES